MKSDAEWNVAQSIIQLEKFATHLERYMRTGDSVDYEYVLESYDLVFSRLNILVDNPQNGRLLAVTDTLGAFPDVLRTRFADLEPFIQNIQTPALTEYQAVENGIISTREGLFKLNAYIHSRKVDGDLYLSRIGKTYNDVFLFFCLMIFGTGVLVIQLIRALQRSDAALNAAGAARSEALNARRELHAVVDSVPALIAAWDRDGRCLFVNSLYTAFHGLTAERIVGRTLSEVEIWGAQRRAVEGVARAGSPLPFSEHPVTDAEGAERILLSTLVPVRGTAGETLGVVDVSLDITERKQRELALAEARDRLEWQAGEVRALAEAAERANRAKSVFLAMMSHEIRTPMNALLGFADLLASSPLPPEQRRYVDIVRDTGRQLLAVLNDVLDFTKLEQGAVEVERIPFRLDELTGSIRPVAEMLLAEKAVTFELTLDPGLPAHVRGDPIRVRQVLANLLSNAAKFTVRGRVHLAVRRDPDFGPTGIRFVVTDSGIGINPARLPRLFQIFSQAEEDTHRRFGGTGLGLAICRRLVEVMGGRIGVGSELGRGSTFWFVLPLEPAAVHEVEMQERAVQPEPTGAARRALKVLVVDDVETNLQLLRALVRRAGHHVTMAVDGAEAIQVVRRDPPDLVLMDVNMPGMDGLEAARRIRAVGGKAGRVPIVALTANAFASDVEECRAAGMDGHLSKPIDVGALDAILDRYATTTVAGDMPTSAVPDETALVDTGQLDRLAELIGVEEVGLLLRRMRGEAAASVEAMRRAVEAGDRQALSSAAHRLAGLAGNLGASRLSEIARSVEQRAMGEPAVDVRVAASALDDLEHAQARSAAAFERWIAARSRPDEAAA